jgi:hypothetical protein
MVATFPESLVVSGRELSQRELAEAVETVKDFWALSRSELAMTLCENLNWKAPNGKLKQDAGSKLLNKLEELGLARAPAKQQSRSPRPPVQTPGWSEQTAAGEEIACPLSELEPVRLTPARRGDQKLWNEYMDRWHPLGYRRPFGAHQRYFVTAGDGRRLGCQMFAASAWALETRDEWIGWSARRRAEALYLVVNQTRFLIFPWVRVKNLASRSLGLAAGRLGDDWVRRYGYRPVLLETFVDPVLYKGSCYRAANWVCLGLTKGRGRQDRDKVGLSSPRLVFMLPQRPDWREVLLGQGGGHGQGE